MLKKLLTYLLLTLTLFINSWSFVSAQNHSYKEPKDGSGRSYDVKGENGGDEYSKRYNNKSNIAKFEYYSMESKNGVWTVLFKVKWKVKEVGIKYKNKNGEDVANVFDINPKGVYAFVIDKDYSIDSENIYNSFVPYIIDNNWKTVYYNSTNYISFLENTSWIYLTNINDWVKISNNWMYDKVCNLRWINYNRPTNAICVNEYSNAWRCESWYTESGNKCIRSIWNSCQYYWNKYKQKAYSIPLNAQCVPRDTNNVWTCNYWYAELWNSCIKIKIQQTKTKNTVYPIKKQSYTPKAKFNNSDILLFPIKSYIAISNLDKVVKEKLLEINDAIPYDAIKASGKKLEALWLWWIVIWTTICSWWTAYAWAFITATEWAWMVPAWAVAMWSCTAWWAVVVEWAAVWSIWLLMDWVWTIWMSTQRWGSWGGGKKVSKITTYDINKIYYTQPYSQTKKWLEKIMSDMKINWFDKSKPILVYIDKWKALIIDGHHRFEAAKQLWYTRIPVQYVQKNRIYLKSGRTLEELRALMHK